MNNLKASIEKNIHPVIFLFFFVFWFSIFIGSGSVFSGYQLINDHQIIAMYNDLTQNNIIEVIKKWEIMDFKTRFKPLLFFHWAIEASIFGTNFTLWIVFNGLMAVFTSFCLFLHLKKIGFPLLESILFPLMSLVGAQAVIWYTNACWDNIGMFFLSLSLMFMAFSIYSEKGRRIYEWLFIIFAILMSLSKENFILMIPALLFWNIWLYKEKNNVQWFDSIKKNIVSTAILPLVMFAELFIIVKWIGTGGYGHGGGLDGFKPLSYLIIAKDMTLSISSIGFGLILLLGISLIILNTTDESLYLKVKTFLKEFYCPIILFLLIAFPQFVIYARSGIFGRYIVPLIVAYSIFLIYLIHYLQANSQKYSIRLPEKNTNIFFLIFIIAGLLIASAGILFLYNQEIRLLFFAKLGKTTPREVADILKPGMLALSVGILIISFPYIVLKRREKKIAIVNTILPLVFMTLFYKLMLTFAGAHEFAAHGKYINSLFQSIEKRTRQGDLILIVVDPTFHNEAGYSIKKYLNSVTKREKVYVEVILLNNYEDGENDNITKGYEKLFNGNTLASIIDKANIRYIVIFSEIEQKFLPTAKDWFNSSNFNREANDLFVVYYKR